MRKQTALWKCKDGSKLRICDMSDRHLANAIALLERAAEHEKAMLPFPVFNGDMAQMCAENEYEAALEAEPGYFFPIYDKLIEEQQRRGSINHEMQTRSTYL